MQTNFSRPNPKRKKTKKSLVKNCRIESDLLGVDSGAVASWRVFRIMAEFVAGFELLHQHGLAATFFGSARVLPGDPVYQQSEELAGKLAKKGFAIITGGGQGVMEAANVGAFKVGGTSIGLNIDLPLEQKLNPYVTESHNFDFFFSRKVMLAFASEVYVYFPGGFGTLDEFFEIITLIQTKKIERIPIVCVGKDFWEPLLKYFTEHLLEKYKTISPEDFELFHIVENVDEAYKYILKNVDTSHPRQI